MAAPQLVITDAGTTAASLSSPNGPYINIVQFKIGTGVNYTPTNLDTGLHGTTLYTGTPSHFYYYDEKTIGIVCEMAADVGPFQFGEIGLYLPNGLFALAAWPRLQSKLHIAIDGVPNVWRFHALIRLQQGAASFFVNTTNQNNLLEVASTAFITAPSAMPTAPNAVIVHEPVPTGEHFMLIRKSATSWSPIKYSFSGSYPITAANTIGVSSPAFADLDGTTPRRYALQFASGEFRLIQAISAYSATLSFPLGSTPTGSCDLYESDAYVNVGSVGGNTDFEEIRTLFNQVWAAPSGTTAATAQGWGQSPVAAPGGNNPSPTDWSTLAGFVKKAADLVGVPSQISYSAINSSWTSGTFVKRMRQIMTLSRVVEELYDRRTDVPATKMELAYAASAAALRTDYWQTVHLDLQVDFDTYDHARAFFNAGGYVSVLLSCSESNYPQSVQRVMFSEFGPIAFRARSTESIGVQKFVFREGDSITADYGNCGFYGLGPNIRKLVWHHKIPVGVGSNAGANYNAINMYLYATGLTATSFKLELWLWDTTQAPFYNYPSSTGYASVPPSNFLRCDPIIGIPPAALVGVTVPTITKLPTTVW